MKQTLLALKGFDVSRQFAHLNREQSKGEEIANSLSHGFGLGAALIGTPILIRHAVQNGRVGYIVGTSVFLATIIFLYFCSTFYHALPGGKAKRIFRVIEHSAIFLLIAGTYTPFTLGVLHGAWGWTLFGVVWGLALAGVILKAFFKATHPMLFTSLYLLLGWVIVIAVGPLLDKVPTAGLLWLLAGGLSYTVGVVFFVTDSRLKYGHLIWHFFVLIGTGCHYLTVLWYAA